MGSSPALNLFLPVNLLNPHMLANIAADCTVLLHLAFILFVVLGGLPVLKFRKLAFFHVPAAIWGVLAELGGLTCPLTPLENMFRRYGESSGYSGGFVEHYITPVIYPSGLTRDTQIALGIGVIVVNLLLYGFMLVRLGLHKNKCKP